MNVDLTVRGWFSFERENDSWALVSADVLPDASGASTSERLLLNRVFNPGLATQEARAYGRQYVSSATYRHRITGATDDILSAIGAELLDAGLVEKNPLARTRLGGRPKLRLTTAGEQARAEADGFRTYLKRAEVARLRTDDEAADVTRNLGYAMAFGLVETWAKQLDGTANGGTAPAAQLLDTMRHNPYLVASAGTFSGDHLTVAAIYETAVLRNYRRS